MIDLHFHCLPGVDDGPVDWSLAVDLCRAAAADGISKVVATPHVLRDPWLNEDPLIRQSLIDELNRRVGGTPQILTGCEFWFVTDLVELVESGPRGPVTTLNGSRYLLVEFAPGYVPREAASVFHELILMNVVPVIAHPERNVIFSRNPERLGALVEKGAVTQLTASSFLGEAGKSALAACSDFIDLGLAHIVASDAHDPVRRPPRLSAAREKVRLMWGAEVEAGLFIANPKAIIENKPLPWLP